jgi:hypothetical protein
MVLFASPRDKPLKEAKDPLFSKDVPNDHGVSFPKFEIFCYSQMLDKNIQHLVWRTFFIKFKGTVSRDFLLPVFFMNQFPPSPRVSH